MMSADNNKKTLGYTAEFSSVDTLLAACRRVRDAGYTKTDAYTPFPVHGIDDALGIKPTVLPFIALGGGLTGTTIALAMQIWMNGIDYPYIISGKPFISLPAFIPVSFELTILLASFGAFFGMLVLNKLPRFSNPIFTNSRFDSATDDKFFLYIGADDARFEDAGVQKLLGDLGSSSVDAVVEDDSSDTLPKAFLAIVASLAMLSIVPLLVAARMRVTTSSSPRFHIFTDMDLSPAKDAQQTTTLFADSRTMRPDVRGTIARTKSGYSADFFTGVDVEALSKMDPVKADYLIRHNAQPPAEEAPVEESPTQELPAAQPPAEATPAEAAPVVQPPAEEAPAEESPAAVVPATEPAAVEPASPAEPEPAVAQDPAAAPKSADEPAPAVAPAQAVVDTMPWLTKNQIPVNRDTLLLGQKQFNIYCAVCHGQDGGGNGLVNVRAQKILASNWVPPSSMHQATLYADVYPDGKLFNTITNGIRKMPGYAGQITANDRWAIVAYVRALQLSRNASESDVPAADLPAIAAAK
jgi:mono/diheme cytochrome c family protein